MTGDSVSLEEKGKQAKEGILDILMVVSVNNLPSTADKSDGFFRRMTIIPFDQKFKRADEIGENDTNVLPVDYGLEDEILYNEMDIVLSFALQGLERMKQNNYKLTKSSAVERVTRNYQLDNNTALAWYEDNKDGKFLCEVPAKALYEAYELWCENNAQPVVGVRTFGQFASKQYQKKRTKNGMCYVGVQSHVPLGTKNFTETINL